MISLVFSIVTTLVLLATTLLSPLSAARLNTSAVPSRGNPVTIPDRQPADFDLTVAAEIPVDNITAVVTCSSSEADPPESVQGVSVIVANAESAWPDMQVRTRSDLSTLLEANQNPLDNDADGLPDAVEGILGTSPELPDTDFDSLTDLYEVQHGLDPVNPDSNYDQLNDYIEIADQGVLDPQKDTDADGETDAWDDDNDGDSVPDALDLSPFAVTDVKEAFKFTLTGNNQDIYVDFQVRPENPEYLNLNGQTWDWPEDQKGLMQDLDDSTEDIKLLPMLELTRIHTGSSYRLMPSKDEVEDYGIIVKDSSTVYVPLNTVSEGGMNAAFNGRMVFPATTETASRIDFNARLVWIVQGTREGIADPAFSTSKDVINFSWSTAGGGTAIGYLDNNTLPDALLMVINDAAENSFRYMVGWDMDATGQPALYGRYFSVRGFGTASQGGDACLYDLDNDGQPETLMVALDNPAGANQFRYMVGSDISESGEFQTWSQVFEGPYLDGNTSGGGIAVADINANGHPDLVLMAVNQLSGADSLTFFTGWDLDEDGQVTGGYTRYDCGAALGDESQGAGLDIADIDGNGTPDYVIDVVDNPEGANRHNYFIGWNVDNSGEPQSVSQRYIASAALASDCSGGGVAIFDIDDNGIADMAMLAVEEADESANNVNLSWGLNLDSGNSHIVGSWGDNYAIPDYLVNISSGQGASMVDLDDNGRMEIMLASLQRQEDGHTPDYIQYTIGWDMDEAGDVRGWAPIRQYELSVDACAEEYVSDVQIYDVDGNDQLDVVIMGMSRGEFHQDGIEGIYYTNHLWYKIGWNIDLNGQPESWGPVVEASEYSTLDGYYMSGLAGGLAVGDINQNEIEDIVLMQVARQSSANYLIYQIGWDIDAGGEVTGWSDINVISGDYDSTFGGDILLADLNESGVLDFVVMAITRNISDNNLYYTYNVGWDIDTDGTIPGGWSDTFTAEVEENNLFGGSLALGDINGNGSQDLVFTAVRDWGKNDIFFYKVAWDVGADKNVILAKYPTPFNLTGFEAAEYYGVDTAIFYSADKDETTRAYVDLRYDFLNSGNSLLDAESYLEAEEIEVENRMDSCGNPDLAVTTLNSEMLPEALDSLPEDGEWPVVIASEMRYSDTGMEGLSAGPVFSLDLDSIEPNTIKSLRLAWFDTADDSLIDSEDFEDIALSYAYSEEETNELLKLLLVWNIGESRLTAVGDRYVYDSGYTDEKLYVMGKIKTGTNLLKNLISLTMYANGMGLVITSIKNAGYTTGSIVPAIKAINKFVSVLKGTKMASGGLAKLEKTLGQSFSKAQMGKFSTSANLAKYLRITGKLLGYAMILYSFWQVASSADWSSTSIMLGTIYASMSYMYMLLLQTISTLPGGAILSGLVLVSDMITQWVTGEGWSQRAMSWVMDAITPEANPCVNTDMEMTAVEFNIDDNDDNGMDVGDTISIDTAYTVTIEANSHTHYNAVINSYMNPAVYFKNSTYYNCTSSAERVYTSDQYNQDQRIDEFETSAGLTWKTPGVNIPVNIVFKTDFHIDMDDYENVEDSQKRTRTLYYDVLPGSLESFLTWSVLTRNDSDGDGLLDTADGREKDSEGHVYSTDPHKLDTDGDGLSDSFEIDFGTDPLRANCDYDNLSDQEEYLLGTDPLVSETDQDTDYDHNEMNEYKLWAAAPPYTVSFFDTDIEIYFTTNPLLSDSDGDGLDDHQEHYDSYTNPCSLDTDGDGTADPDDSQPRVYSASLAGSRIGAAFDKEEERYLETGPLLNNRTDWVLGAWIKPDAEMEEGVIYSEGSPDKLASISLDADGRILVETSRQESGETLTSRFTTPENTLAAGEWHLVLVRFNLTDEAAGTGQITVEVNGDRYTGLEPLYMQQQPDTNQGVFGLDSTHLRLADYPANEFKGYLDEIYFWTEVEADTDYRFLLAQSREDPYDLTADNLQKHWNFDEYQIDASGNISIKELTEEIYNPLDNGRLVTSDAPLFEATSINQSTRFELPYLFFGETGGTSICEITAQPAHGSVYTSTTWRTEGPLIRCTYTPDDNFTGSDNFTYRVAGNEQEYSAESTVQVEVYNIPVTGIRLRCNNTGEEGTLVDVPLSEGARGSVYVLPFGASNSNVIWNNSDPDIVTCIPYHSDETLTNGATFNSRCRDGEALVSVTTEEGGYSGLFRITTTPPRVVQFNHEQATLTAGESLQCVKVTDDSPGEGDNITLKVIPEDNPLFWESTATDKMTVDDNGTLTTNKVGTAYVYATAQDAELVRDYCRINILPYTTGLELSKNNTMISIDQTDDIDATVLPEDARDLSVVFESSDTGIATVELNEQSGNISTLRITGHKAGTATLNVSTRDYAFTESCQVVVSPFSTVVLNKTATSLRAGRSENLTATVQDINPPYLPTGESLYWVSSDPTVVVVDAYGCITAKTVGTAYIEAFTLKGAVSLPCEVEVLNCVTEVLLDIELINLYLDGDNTQILTATATLAEALETDEILEDIAVWTSDDPLVAAVEALDKENILNGSGQVTAVRYRGEVTGVGDGYTSIHARSPDQSGCGAACQTHVHGYTTGVSLDVNTLSLTAGESSAPLTASVLPENDPPYGVIWSSDKPEIAEVDSSGVITAHMIGTAQITATTEDRAYSDVCTVTVTPYYTEILLDRSELVIYVGEEVDLIASLQPDNTSAPALWESGSWLVAGVTDSGRVIPVQPGVTSITATTPDGALSTGCEVTVMAHPAYVLLNKYTSELNVGNTDNLTAVIIPLNAENMNVIWESSAPSIVTVDSRGNITAISAGTADVSAITEDGGIGNTCRVTVAGTGTVDTEPLETPAQPEWNEGEAVWQAVPQENNGYSLQLYRDSAAEGTAVEIDHSLDNATRCDVLTGTLSGPALSFDFSGRITAPGNYTFTVTALGMGLYTDSTESEASDPWCVSSALPVSEKPVLNGYTATWQEADDAAAGYLVRLYRNGVLWAGPIELAHAVLSYDFSADMTEAGSYTVTVTQSGTGLHTDSPESAHSDPYVVTAAIEQPEPPVLLSSGAAFWTPVENENNGYSAQLYKDNATAGPAVNTVHGAACYVDFSAAMTTAGVYSVTVTAHGKDAYLDSAESEPSSAVTVTESLPQPQKPWLDNYTASWSAVTGENAGYTVQLYLEGSALEEAFQVEPGVLTCDCTEGMSEPGSYTATVTALGSGIYRDSPESDPSDPQVVEAAGSATISTVNPQALAESAANDGSLLSGLVVLTIENGDLAAGFSSSDLIAWNLPYGLEYQAVRTDNITLTIDISGQAEDNTDADDVDNLFWEIDSQAVEGAAGNLLSGGITINFDDPPACIISTTPLILIEADSDNGSLESGTVVVTIGYGTLAEDIGQSDITARNLPAGLDFAAAWTDNVTLTLDISGRAVNHGDAHDVDNLTFTLAQSKVNLAENDLTTDNLTLDFNNAPQPAAPTLPVVDDDNDTYGWTGVPGFTEITEYEYSLDNATTWNGCSANPQPVGNADYATGQVQVRVKAETRSGREAGEALLSDAAFTLKPQTDTPVANPVGGGVLAGTEVVLSCTTDNSTIYYTTDGSEPTTGSAEYQDPLVVNTAGVIKAVAAAPGHLDSAVMSEEYTINSRLSRPAAPVLQQSMAVWSEVVNENGGYRVTLYKDDLELKSENVTHGAELSLDFSADIVDAGSYTASVVALGETPFADSLPSDRSDPQIMVATGGVDGQAILDADLQLGDNATIDLNAGIETAAGSQITIGGELKELDNYTGGELSNVDLTLPQSVGDQNIQVQQAVRVESSSDGQPVVIAGTEIDCAISIPDGTAILAPEGWDGVIIPPVEVPAAGTAPSGFSIGGTVIEVGTPGAVLLFDQPVTLELAGVTGTVGYKPANSDNWVEITLAAGGTYESPLPTDFPGEAFITNGVDTKIITWHLTDFTLLEEREPSLRVVGGEIAALETTVLTPVTAVVERIPVVLLVGMLPLVPAWRLLRRLRTHRRVLR